MIYLFKSQNSFNKFKDSELKLLDKDDVIFAKVKYIPNPWYVHPIINGKIIKDIVLNPKELSGILKKRFKK